MRLKIGIILVMAVFSACNLSKAPPQLPIIGTWELISATSTEKDSTISTFNPDVRMIKIINPTHFAFLSHDLHAGKDTANAVFIAGGGTYTLVDSLYTEHLEYFIDRAWEKRTFDFVVKINNDTLIQEGIEKLPDLGIDHVIVEKYKRVK